MEKHGDYILYLIKLKDFICLDKYYYAMEFINRTTQDMDRGETHFGIFLDLSKAFDTLNHTILLKKWLRY